MSKLQLKINVNLPQLLCIVVSVALNGDFERFGRKTHQIAQMGPLHDPVTWYKIIYTGEQVAQWDFQNNATRTSSPGPAFVLEVPLRNLLTSIYNFVPCDRIVQRAHSPFRATETTIHIN